MRKYLRKFQKSTMRSSVNGHENTAPGMNLIMPLSFTCTHQPDILGRFSSYYKLLPFPQVNPAYLECRAVGEARPTVISARGSWSVMVVLL